MRHEFRQGIFPENDDSIRAHMGSKKDSTKLYLPVNQVFPSFYRC